MSSPLPVPSKAALTALRGLLVGTSCTLALVAEDRRRRINNALRVIDNGAKVKSARNYRAGGTAFALALEEEAWFDSAFASPGLPESTQAPPRQLGLGQSTETPRRGGESAAPLVRQDLPVAKDTVKAGRIQPAEPTPPVPSPFIQPLTDRNAIQTRPSIVTSRSSVGSRLVVNHDRTIARIHNACDTQDPEHVSGAVRAVLDAYHSNTAPDGLSGPWMDATARLCRTCQQLGRVDDAANILEKVGSDQSVTEADYFAHKPMALIRLLLDQATKSADWSARREILLCSRKLFRPTLERDTPSREPGVLDTGKLLIEALILAKEVEATRKVFKQCLKCLGDEWGFADWYATKIITNVQDTGEYKFAILKFLELYGEVSTDTDILQAIGDSIVDSVEKSNGYRAADVLRKLFKLSSRVCKPKTHWVTKLFAADWASHRSFEKTEALFDELVDGLDPKAEVPWAAIYRIMVELALETGEKTKADHYLQKRESYSPEVSKDIRLLGIFARYHAKLGNWEMVRSLFESMKINTVRGSKACGDVFVPVLKAFANGHSIRETETFVRLYTEQLKVPLCRYSVTLMAKHYAKIHDYDAILRWLDFCAKADFAVDAAFTNAILESCRHAGMPFRTLRTFYRKLAVLNPAFVDCHTERIMAGAALANPKNGGKLAQGRVLSLRLNRGFLPPKLKLAFTHEDDVVLSMKEAMTLRDHTRVVRLFKTAVRMGVPLSRDTTTLRLAMQAAMSISTCDKRGDRGDKAYDLLRFAQDHGQDVNHITNHIIATQLKEMSCKGDQATIHDTLVSILGFFEGKGIVLADVTLNRAADICLEIGYLENAISYAKKAAEVRGYSRPGYNLHNFRIMLSAYIAMGNVEGVAGAVAIALSSRYAEETACLETLKYARRRVRRDWPASASQQDDALAAIQNGIQSIVGKRSALQAKRRRFEEEGLRIMRQAALDAGCAPVEFDSMPWLGGKKENYEPLEVGFDETWGFTQPAVPLVSPGAA